MPRQKILTEFVFRTGMKTMEASMIVEINSTVLPNLAEVGKALDEAKQLFKDIMEGKVQAKPTADEVLAGLQNEGS